VFTIATWFIIVLPLIFPIGLPIDVSERTREFYGYLQALKPGDIVIHNADTLVGTVEANIITFKYLIKNKIKWIGWAGTAASAAYTEEALTKAGAFNNPNYQYGVDWVWLGYIPGEEAAHLGIRDSFQSFITVDYKGTPSSQLPLLKGFRGDADCNMFIGTGESQIRWARIWPSRPGRPTLAIFPTDALGKIIPYYPQAFVGLLSGLQGAAELEFLSGMPGQAISMNDAVSASVLVLMAATILTQVVGLSKRTSKGVVK